MESEKLIENAAKIGDYLFENLKLIDGIKESRGRGLMIGIEFEQPVDKIRDNLLFDYKIFCGYSGKNTLRLLPSLALGKKECDIFLEALAKVIKA